MCCKMGPWISFFMLARRKLMTGLAMRWLW